MLSVGASMTDDKRYSWSNYGASWVDVAAPGCNLAQSKTGTVVWFCGTSSATPFAAGVAALARSLDPQPSAVQIRNLLTATAKAVPGSWVAHGRVEADGAVTRAAWNSGVAAGQTVKGTLRLQPWYNAGLGVTTVVASIDGVVRATDTAAPWSLAVTPAGSPGRPRLTRGANRGPTPVGQTLSSAVVVDNGAPTVSFRSPAVSARVGRTVTVTASAADAVRVARVQLLANGRVVATDTAAPWSLRWASAGSGHPTLTLRAYDGAGTSASVARRVILDNAGPPAAITSGPPNGRKNVRGTVTVRVRAADPAGVAKVQLLVNNRVVGTVTGAAGTFKVATARYGRTLKVKARAYDRLGNAATSSTRTWRR